MHTTIHIRLYLYSYTVHIQIYVYDYTYTVINIRICIYDSSYMIIHIRLCVYDYTYMIMHIRLYIYNYTYTIITHVLLYKYMRRTKILLDGVLILFFYYYSTLPHAESCREAKFLNSYRQFWNHPIPNKRFMSVNRILSVFFC
jgi:hypothetical protein